MRNGFRHRLACLLLVVAAPFALADGTAGEAGGAAPVRPASGTPSGAADAARRAFLAKCRYEASEAKFEVDAPRKMGERLVLETLRFPSPVRSADPERNDVVRAKLFRTETPEPAAVIFLGGWRRDPLTPTLAARFAETGAQALWIELPFQGDRTPKGRFTGDVTLSADLDQNEATFVQIAQDVARAADWLVRERKVDPKRIGLLGTSLGGFAVASLYGMDDRWAGAAVQLAGADVASVLFNGNWLTRNLRDALVAKGLDEEAVRTRMAPLDPGTWARPERKAGLVLLAAEEDEIVPLASVRTLAEAWGGARTLTIPGASHISGNEIAARFPELRDHLTERLGLKKSAEPAAGAPAEPATK